jgi:hypothetical protein
MAVLGRQRPGFKRDPFAPEAALNRILRERNRRWFWVTAGPVP